MNRGEHIYKVTLKKRVLSYDSHNQQVEDWDSADRTIFAEKWERQGKEADTQGQIIVIQDVRWKLRYIKGLNEKDYRIEWNDRQYDIVNIIEEGRSKFQLILTQLRDNG